MMNRRNRTPPGPCWVYILECKNGLIYTGIARDVEARLQKHRSGSGSHFTKINKVSKLLGKKEFPNRSAAQDIERKIKDFPTARRKRVLAAKWVKEALSARHDNQLVIIKSVSTS